MSAVGIYDACHAAGGMTMYEWERDPKRLAFILARYKFVAKMFAGKDDVLEVGCADGYGSRVVRQEVRRLTAIDLDVQSIEEALRKNYSPRWPIDYCVHDMLKSPMRNFDAAFALDVLEHIEPRREKRFLTHLAASAPVLIIGMPSLESQQYASKLSKEGHVNCKTAEQLRATMLRYYREVFLFGMNDEVLHVGYERMRQYHFALCVE